MLRAATPRRNDVGHCLAVVRAPLADTGVRHCSPAPARTAWVDVSTERPAHDGGAVNVVTVDDQPHFRVAARDVIGATPGFESVGEACSGAEALEVVEELGPQLVLVDVRMPDMDGIETARRMKAAHPDIVVVLISIEDVANVPAAASTSGAAALVQKQDFKPSLLRRLWSEHGNSG
jgi:two-component system invasion response regulator UvrY